MTRLDLAALDARGGAGPAARAVPDARAAGAPAAAGRGAGEPAGAAGTAARAQRPAAGSLAGASRGAAAHRPAAGVVRRPGCRRIAGRPPASCCCWPCWPGPPTLALPSEVTGGRAAKHLAPPERAGLVRADDDTRQLVFRHPLTRSAVVGMSTAQERTEACRKTSTSCRRTSRTGPGRHLAVATVAPDGEVAVLLEGKSGRRMLRRGVTADAAARLARGRGSQPRSGRAQSPPRRGRVHRRHDELADGPGARAASAGPAGPAVAPSAELHAVSTGVYFMLNGDGDLDTAHRRLVEAIEANGGDFNADNPCPRSPRSTPSSRCAYGAGERTCGHRTSPRWRG